MPERIAILHYASPPVVGGVESTIAHHARGLADLGYPVRVITGLGEAFDARVEVHVEPLFGSRDPQVSAVKKELDTGVVSETFRHVVARQVEALRQALDGCDVCIVHNAHTLNKNLPLSAVLHQLENPRLIAWCHDLAWTNPQYLPELHAGYPWDLLRQPWANTRYVTISEPRQQEMAALLKIPPEQITVIGSGVDIASFLQWTDTTRLIEARLHLMDADLLLLLPARLTRRKNIGLGLHVLHALRQQAVGDVRLIVTGPPGPHNPANPGYLGELLALRDQLGLQGAAHFLYELTDPPLIPDDVTMSTLYQLADALFFPSSQEGFGIPMLEAGLVGLPVFCSNLAPLRQTGQHDVTYFDPEQDSAAAIAGQIRHYFADNPRQRLKQRIRRDYRWDAIIRDQLIPLLEAK